MGLHKSTDGGDTWTTYRLTSTSGCAYAVAIDSVDDNIIYVGGKYATAQGYQGILFKSLDGGENWSDITESISGIIYAVAVDPVLRNQIYAGTTNGMYKSEDSGFSWTRISYFDVNSITINPEATNEIFAGGRDGVYLSENGGNTWQSLNNTFILDHVNCFDMDEVNSILYAGTFGSIYRNRLLEQYMLALQAGSGGTTDPTPKGYILDLDSGVTLTAIPDTDWGFIYWSGDVPVGQEYDNPFPITVDSDKYISANFIQLRCTLTIASISGGTTDPSPGSHKYDTDTVVTINALPDSNHKFNKWTGDVPAGQHFSNPLTLAMNSNKSITADFITSYEPGNSFCFIATAAYDSPLHPYVNILRDFRDKYLMPGKLGRFFVHLYYTYSPFLAKIITKCKPLKIAVQTSLLPLIALSYIMLRVGLAGTAALLALISVLPVFLIHFYRRKPRNYRARS